MATLGRDSNQYYAFQVDERFSKGRRLGNKNLIPLPHQIEAVYSRMLQVPQVRFLLADDPGAGKTIMAGMLIKELKARESVKRILILVPPLVLKQWQMELKEKFGDLVITDGTGRELTAELLYLAKRENGTIISLDSYWLFQSQFEGEHISLNESHDPELHSAAVKASIKLRNEVRKIRENQLDKVAKYLQKTFTKQIEDILDKRTKYEEENIGNRNSVLINQMTAQLIDVETRRDERLALIERQRHIGMKPPKRLLQLELIPNGKAERLISVDYQEMIEKHERNHGRQNALIINCILKLEEDINDFNAL
nr:SNF2-related protein [Caldalkalibacillus thermarum]